MDHYGKIVVAKLGFSASLFLCFALLRKKRKKKKGKWQNKKITQDKLRTVNEALGEAEQGEVEYEERRDDRILSQICSRYFVNQDNQTFQLGSIRGQPID